MPSVVRGNDDFDSATSYLGLGEGQTWSDVTASRTMGTTYTNSTGRPIAVSINPNLPQATTWHGVGFRINGAEVATSRCYGNYGTFAERPNMFIVVPDGATYSLNIIAGSPTIIYWRELR